MSIQTQLTDTFGVKHPIIQAGMNVAAGPELAAAVCNAGGIGVIGGLGYSPKFLRQQIQRLKDDLVDKNSVFGVDLLLPKVGAGARKTNYDYTGGTLPLLIEEIIKGGAKLFVSAVGVPERWVVEKLHKHNIMVMNMTGLPKHAKYAMEVGCDIICCQGTEAGGHTGDLASSVLIPATVDAVKGHKSELTGQPIMVIAAGGIYDGRGLAAALAFGADGVWVGTRFVCAAEAGASANHQQEIISASFADTKRTLCYTGRPLRVKNKAALQRLESRTEDVASWLNQGKIPIAVVEEELREKGELDKLRELNTSRRLLMGQNSGAIQDVLPAKEIVESMVREAVTQIDRLQKLKSKL